MRRRNEFRTKTEYNTYIVRYNKKRKRKPKRKPKDNKRRKAYLDYLSSDEWSIIKIEMREYYGNECQLCSSKVLLDVHHKHYKNFGNEEPNDLMLVCRDCHKDIHKE